MSSYAPMPPPPSGYPPDASQSQQPYHNLDSHPVDLPTIIHHPKKLMSLKVLVLVITGCSVLIFLFGVAALSMSLTAQNMDVRAINETKMAAQHSSDPYWHPSSFHYHLGPPCCLGGTSLWGGVVLIITAAFGLATVRYPLQKCSRITFLVLAVIATVLSAVICIMHGIWAGVISGNNRWQLWRLDNEFGEGNWWLVGGWKIAGVIVLNAIICLLGFVNMVCLIVASSLWCCNWCSCCGGGTHSSDSEPVRYTLGYPQPQQAYPEAGGYASGPTQYMSPPPVYQSQRDGIPGEDPFVRPGNKQ